MNIRVQVKVFKLHSSVYESLFSQSGDIDDAQWLKRKDYIFIGCEGDRAILEMDQGKAVDLGWTYQV